MESIRVARPRRNVAGGERGQKKEQRGSGGEGSHGTAIARLDVQGLAEGRKRRLDLIQARAMPESKRSMCVFGTPIRRAASAFFRPDPETQVQIDFCRPQS
jgi:hypothetical protein